MNAECGQLCLTGYWWNVCGFSRQSWQSVLALCLKENQKYCKHRRENAIM